MLSNANYNLLEEIVQLSQSLYRYDAYEEDAEDEAEDVCRECSDIWVRLRQRHEEDLDLLLRQLKRHIDMGILEFPSGT